MSDTLTKNENIIYQLETLASYEPADLDNPEFEVGYEDESGNEGFATVCCIDVATKALLLIEQLQRACDSSLLALRHMEHETMGHKNPFQANRLVCYELLVELENKQGNQS